MNPWKMLLGAVWIIVMAVGLARLLEPGMDWRAVLKVAALTAFMLLSIALLTWCTLP